MVSESQAKMINGEIKRYAIRFPDGSFSNGLRREPVSFEKAKLWKQKNHLTNHLGSKPVYYDTPYPDGSKVVEVMIRSRIEVLCTVEAALEGLMDRREVREACWEKEDAERELQEAQERLSQAQKRFDGARD
jgi:hypothetical protein